VPYSVVLIKILFVIIADAVKQKKWLPGVGNYDTTVAEAKIYKPMRKF